MADAVPNIPKDWSLERLIAAIRETAPQQEVVTIEQLRHKRTPPKLPDLDSLQSALGRIVEAIQGKPIGPQRVQVGRFRDGSARFGVREYAAHVAVRDALAVGLFLDSKRAHDESTRNLYDGALNAKWGQDGAPHYIQQNVGDLFHMLQVAAMAGA